MAANSAQTSSGGGGKLKFKPTKGSSAQLPTIPSGKWIDSLMPRGRFKVQATKEKPGGGGNNPMLLIPIKLGKADDDANESYQGAEEVMRVIFYSDDDGANAKASNINRQRLRSLCEAVEVDYDEVYPTSIEDESDLHDLISHLEGKKIPELWTRTRESEMPSGEKTVNVDFYFTEARGGLAKADEDEDETPTRGSKAKGKKR
jgi:hypothetical protein